RRTTRTKTRRVATRDSLGFGPRMGRGAGWPLRGRVPPSIRLPMPQAKKKPETEDLADLPRLIERMRAGERRATSRVVTELERLSKAVPRLLELMQPHLGTALVVGFTGPPGAGKSTFVNAYTAHLRAEGKSIGIIAVDPSSPVSGGAILGDRI